MKGISTIIATILLLIITIALSGTAYLFFGGLFTGVTSKTISLIDANGYTVIVQNMGNQNITSNDIKILVNGQQTQIANPQEIKPQSSVLLKFVPPNFDDELKSARVLVVGPSNSLSYTTDFTLPHEVKAAAGTVGLWHFNEGRDNNTYDSSGINNNGKFINETFNDGSISGASWVDGKYGKALSFDGVNDYVDVAANNQFNSDEQTVELWFYVDDLSTREQGVIGKDISGSNNWMLYRNVGDGAGSLYWFIYYTKLDTTVDWVITDIFPPLSTWTHTAFVFNSTGYWKSYKNGTLINSGQAAGFSSWKKTATSVRIGSISGYILAGKVDEVRIYNRTLSQQEIQADMQSSMPVARPVASYSFEEGSGQFANDTHIWVKGKFGSALSFDGVNDYVNVGNDASLVITGPITVEAWVKGNAQPSGDRNEHIVSKQGSYVLGWDHTQPQHTTFWINSTTAPWINAGSISNPSANKWYHLAGVFDGSNLILYVNGLKATSKYVGAQTINTCIDNVTIGSATPTAAFFNGTIDEVAIYNRTLTQEEIIDSIYG